MSRRPRATAAALRSRVAVPAALVGSLAATFAVTPAAAAEVHETRVASPQWEADRVKDGHSASVFRGDRAHRAPSHVSRSALRISTTEAVPPSYTVRAGDTVWGIAAKYGLSMTDVLSWNGLDSSSIIRPGQVLALFAPASAVAAPTPAPAPAAAVHTVGRGDTVSAIAGRYGTSISAVLGANGLTWDSIIYPGQALTIPGASAPVAAPAPIPAPAPAPAPVVASHTVQRGDTLSGIAAAYGIGLQELFAANGLGSASIIYPGQALSVPGAATTAAPAAPVAPAAPPTGLDAEQTANAQLIIQIGRELGVSDRGIAIALATAMVESWIRNLDWGDRDSLGLFQQRPSTGWGSPDEVRDAARSIRVFYGGPSDPNGSRTRGLLDISGWEGLGFSEAAQSVQRSAHPDRYGAWESAAYQWLAALG